MCITPFESSSTELVSSYRRELDHVHVGKCRRLQEIQKVGIWLLLCGRKHIAQICESGH